jgi:hypothetical protein
MRSNIKSMLAVNQSTFASLLAYQVRFSFETHLHGVLSRPLFLLTFFHTRYEIDEINGFFTGERNHPHWRGS